MNAPDPHGELDAVLRSLHDLTPDSAASLGDVRARVLAAAAEEAANGSSRSGRRRTGLRYVPVAAAVAAVIVGATVVAVSVHGGQTTGGEAITRPANHQPAVQKPAISLASGSAALDSAATLTAHTATAPVRPGQFRYVRVDALVERSEDNMTTGHEFSYSYLANQVIEDWIPFDYKQEWQEKRTLVGTPKFLGSSSPVTKLPPVPTSGYDTGLFQGDCGNFFPKSQGTFVCGNTDDWDSPAFYQALPDNPDALLAKIKQLAAPKDGGPATWFDYGVQIMSTGLVPPAQLSSWYQALAKIPGVQVIDKATTLRGRAGVALGINDDNAEFRELIVDPSSGQLIGSREVAGAHPYDSYIKPGTVLSDVALTLGVANKLGQAPTN